MPMPLRQSMRVGSYLMRQKLTGTKKFPLLVELEPLFACNLKCAGCGKIQQPHTLLKQRMPVDQAIAAIEECGAPMVSIAGGEPLMHPQIDEIVRRLIAKKKFVFLCTNALLLPKKLDKFKPSPYFAWVVHLDGLRERHDESVCKEGVFDEAVAAGRRAIDLNPENAGALSNFGIALFDQGKFEEALACLDRALAIEENFAQAHSNRGNALQRLKRFAEAGDDVGRIFRHLDLE